jgi:biotin synthase
MLDQNISLKEIKAWLKETDPLKLQELWDAADKIRAEHVGDEVHLRGLIEISNYCARSCEYCGLHVKNKEVQRYRMNRHEILECAQDAVKFGYGTVVMQAGEDYGLQAEWIAEIIRDIKKTTDLAVTLSLGERPYEELKLWKEAGANRYLLRFETSDDELYKIIHPNLGSTVSDRITILKQLKELGYETGSGVMVGFPGQTWDILAKDIATFRELQLHMIGIGPYISHPQTGLGKGDVKPPEPAPEDKVPSGEDVVYKAVALTRLVCPDANLPATTALATINKEEGREHGLQRGANIVMPNLTPPQYRALYEIYPDKACVNETADMCQFCLRGRVESIGRTIGKGQGTSPAFQKPE